MAIEVRKARPEEAKDLARYFYEVHGDDYDFEKKRFDYLIAQSFIILAMDDGKIIGRILFQTIENPKFGAGMLESFVVSESYRGQGIGTRMLQNSIDEAKTYFQEHGTNLRFLYLFTRSNNEGAHRLYERFGFKKGPTIGQMFRDNEPDEMVMSADFRR